MDALLEPWPWYVSGPMIALIMFVLIFMGKKFGMSSNLRTACSILGAGKSAKFFRYDFKADYWNLVVVLGAIIGGFIARQYLMLDEAVKITEDTVKDLSLMGFSSAGKAYMPTELFSLTSFTDIKSLIVLATGGLLIGFGARYAGGCTSGHAISGLSNLQLPSLYAVLGFFIGGLLMVHILFPLIF